MSANPGFNFPAGAETQVSASVSAGKTAHMEPTFSTVEVARRLGVSVQTVQRWVDDGKLRAWKTLGGHRRIDASDANALFRAFSSAPVTQEERAIRGPAVLVVDNEADDRELAISLVQSALPLATVTGAVSGFEALLAAGQQQFDVLITDVVMPHMNGFEMLRHLASAGPRRPRFLLAISSHSLDALRYMGPLPPEVVLMSKPLMQNGFVPWLTSRFPYGLRHQP